MNTTLDDSAAPSFDALLAKYRELLARYEALIRIFQAVKDAHEQRGQMIDELNRHIYLLTQNDNVSES